MVTRRSVPPEVYDSAYLLSDNTEGYQEFREGSLSFVKQLQLDMLELEPGMTLLEVGMGRGEFLCHCAKRGARVTGIDYSEASLEIGRKTLRDVPDADLRCADSRDLPFEDDSFDRVYAGDVLEHMDLEDGVVMLREMVRVARPGGSIFVHTAPNAVFMKYVYPLLRPLLKRIDPNTVKTLERHLEVNRAVHVHEYSLFSLRKVAARAGLVGAEIWIGEDILRSSRHRHTATLSQHPLVRLVRRFQRLGVVRFFLGNDLFLRMRKADREPARQ